MTVTATDFVMSVERPTAADIRHSPEAEELRGCRQISDITVETFHFNESMRLTLSSSLLIIRHKCLFLFCWP